MEKRARMGRLRHWTRREGRSRDFDRRGDAGMATAEYAMVTLAACGFAAVLFKVLTGGSVTGALLSLIQRALHVPA
jgi:Protein of unknown function (DUF4244)